METVLLTGGAGYVGSHIALNLLKRNYKVLVFDSFVNSSKNVFKNLEKIFNEQTLEKNLSIINGDLRNLESLINLFNSIHAKGQKIKHIIHCAGLKSVQVSCFDSLNYWDVNVGGTINLLKTMNMFSCKNIIFSSSATVYDLSGAALLNENSKLKPINPYGNTKFVIEKLLQDISLNSREDWNIINLRYFNPIGADPDGILGENPTSERNNIFPLILDVALKRKEKFTIFGNDWDTIDGTCVRDYIHIHDLAESHVRALEYLSIKSPKFLNLNIGTGNGTSVLELIETFEKTNNVKVPYIFGKKRKGDFGSVVADANLANSILGWSSKKSLEDMCRDGWRWFLNSNF